MLKKNTILIVVLVLAVLIVIRLFYFGREIAHIISKTNKIVESDSSNSSMNEPLDYATLFYKNNSVQFNKAVESKTRNPIVEYLVSNKFKILVCKIDTSTSLSLKKLIVETHKNVHISYGYDYYNLNLNYNSTFFYVAGKQQTMSKIYFNVVGTEFKILAKEDSLVYYYSKFKNFYVKYRELSNQEFYGRINDTLSNNNIPIEILFIKKRHETFIAIMTAENTDVGFIPGTLLRIIKNKYNDETQ